MGRRPKPTQLKIREGHRGHRRLDEDDFQPPIGPPEMPRFLSPEARREFRFMSRVLVDRGLLSVVDGKALAAYCFSYAQAEEAQRYISKHGQLVDVFVLDEKTGKWVFKRRNKNPAIAIYHRAVRTMKSFLTEFGLTPASRRNLDI